MLKPIKTFFNYLQKNANTSNIFRLSNDLNMSDELSSAPLESENEAFEDPLTDPLAIDDVDATVAVEENVNNIEEVVSDEENNPIDNFIFVDIEKLKSKISKGSVTNGAKLEPQSQLKAASADKKKNNCSDINGNKSEHSPQSDSELVRSATGSKDAMDGKQSEPSAGEGKSAENGSQLTNGHSDVKSVETTNFVINSEAETDEVTDTSSVLLEEIRSDGSDSGLGLDTLRNISVIEKNLATLTPAKSSLKRRSEDALHEDQPKKRKAGNINFGNVMVYYFPRCQGFSCVPTQGGSTLGMTAKHAYKKTFTLTEHAMEQRRLNRLKMAGNELNPSSSSSDESKSEDEISENSLSEADNEAYGFLQPVTARQRRAILKLAGVRKIDSMEKDECRQLRLSREVCGCACNGYCDPDTCECSLAGIKCQVDRLKPHEFPCGCTRDGCANVNGRIEFNPSRVKTHFIHTIMRLELEKRQELSDVPDMSTGVIQHHPPSKWWSQMRLSSSSSTAAAGAQHTNSGNYGYMYGATQQYPTTAGGKIPPISTMVSPAISQESLDLHFAYRDDYSSALSLGAETAASASVGVGSNGGGGGSSFATSNDYYANYTNYASSSSSAPSTSTSGNGAYHSGYHPHAYHHSAHHQNHHHNHHHHHHLNYGSGSGGASSSDCQYSNYAATAASTTAAAAGATTSGYRIDAMNEINGYYTPTSSSASMVHNGASTSRISYQSVIAATPSAPEITQTPAESSNYCAPAPTATSEPASSESNENLSEIIKKSIVESVTA